MYNNYNNNYGWGNAVADIVGAIVQRNAQRGEEKKQANMYLDAANFGEDLNNLDMGGKTTFQDLGSRDNPNSNYTNKTAQNKAMQGLLPTSFNKTMPATFTPTSDGLFSNFEQPSMLQNVGEQQDNNNIVNSNGNSNGFEITNPADKYLPQNNPVSITKSAPKTLQEQQRMIKSQQGQAMKELIAKGYNPKDILPLLQQTTNEKIAELTANNQDRVVNELYQGFISKEADANPNLKAMYAARLKQAGYDVMTAYKEFAPEYKFEKFDNGDTNEGYSFNPKTGKLEKQVSITKGIDPGVVLTNNTRVLTTQMNNDTSRYNTDNRRVGGTGGGRGSTPKLGKQESWALNYESGNGLTNDESTISILSELDNPTPSQQNQLQQALGRRDHYWKVSSGGQYGAPEQQEQSQSGNDDGASWYDREYRNAINEGLTPEQATQYMSDIIKQNGG